VSEPKLLHEVRDGVARLTLHRPDAANAIDLAVARALAEAALRCERDPDVRAVVLTGSGRAFCAGGDLRAFAAAGEDVPGLIREMTGHLHLALSRLARGDAPVIAAVNGVAAGAGMSLACAADLALAAESARFTMAYTRAGLAPDGSSTWFLPRLVGARRAQELLLTNRVLSAAEAFDWGLVNRVVPDAQLAEEAAALAAGLAGGATRAYGHVKSLLQSSAALGLESQMERESRAIAAMAASEDGREGIEAFLAKREPRFRGR